MYRGGALCTEQEKGLGPMSHVCHELRMGRWESMCHISVILELR